MFSVFNDSFHIRQQGLQFSDNPRHGVGHGMQSQGVAVEQHEAQIFLARGFDNCVLRLKGVGAKPVQKLRKHSKFVQAGGRIHDQCILGALCVVCVCHRARRDVDSPARCDTESRTGTAGRRPGGRTCAS